MDFSPARIGLMKNTAVLVKKVTQRTLFLVLAFKFIEGEAFICKGSNRTKYPVSKIMKQKR
jgi:hypothetical protein